MSRHEPLALLRRLAPALLVLPTFGEGGGVVAPPPLRLDVTRIAVRGAPSASVLARAGIDATTCSASPVADWRLYAVPAGSRSARGVRSVLAAVLEGGEVPFAAPVFLDELGGPAFPTAQLLVGFDPGVGAGEARAILAEHGAGQILEQQWAGMEGAFRLRPGGRDGFEVLATAARLAAAPEVAFAEPDFVFTGRSGFFPNDTGFGDCWGLHNTGQMGGTPDMDVDAPEAWERTIGDPSVLMVVIDTGVQRDHPDLRMVLGADVTSSGPGDGSPTSAFENHGTAVAGCVAATIDNGLGTVGLASGCRCASARSFIGTDATGGWTSVVSWTVDALDWAQNAGARVTINSNAYGFQSNAIASKYASTRSAGMVHFAISGNSAQAGVAYPGSLPSVNAIGALDRDGFVTGFSNFGPELAFTAPGLDILTTDRTGPDGWVNGDYTTVFGTSFAAPYAAGVAALLLSTEPQLSALEVEQAMKAAAVDRGPPGFDDHYGFGLVNAARTIFHCATEAYCNSTSNSTGAAATIAARGTESVSTNDLTLLASDVVPGLFGLFFYGGAPGQTPFGDGVLCVAAGQTVFRIEPPVLADANGVARRPLDYSLPPMDTGAGRITSGGTWHFQYWYRDPLVPGGAGFNLSHGLRVTFCP